MSRSSSDQRKRPCRHAIYDLVSKAEANNKELVRSAFGLVIDYKQAWTKGLERRQRLGLNPTDPVSHSDDTILDASNMGVQNRGAGDLPQPDDRGTNDAASGIVGLNGHTRPKGRAPFTLRLFAPLRFLAFSAEACPTLYWRG